MSNRSTKGHATMKRADKNWTGARCSDWLEDYQCNPPKRNIQIHKHCPDMFDDYECRMHASLKEATSGTDLNIEEDFVSFLGSRDAQPKGFDYIAATAGFSVGFVAVYAILRSLKTSRKLTTTSANVNLHSFQMIV